MWRVKEFYEPEDFPKEEQKAENTKNNEQNTAQNTECTSPSGSLPTGEGGGRGSFPITSWAEDDRPREKLARIGAENLSDAELIAILIGSGNTK